MTSIIPICMQNISRDEHGTLLSESINGNDRTWYVYSPPKRLGAPIDTPECGVDERLTVNGETGEIVAREAAEWYVDGGSLCPRLKRGE